MWCRHRLDKRQLHSSEVVVRDPSASCHRQPAVLTYTDLTEAAWPSLAAPYAHTITPVSTAVLETGCTTSHNTRRPSQNTGKQLNSFLSHKGLKYPLQHHLHSHNACTGKLPAAVDNHRYVHWVWYTMRTPWYRWVNLLLLLTLTFRTPETMDMIWPTVLCQVWQKVVEHPIDFT